MRRPATSNTQYSTMPARAYRPALVLRSKPSVESATSTTSWRSTGRGFSSVKWEKSRFRTIWLDCQRLELIEGELIDKMGKKRPHVNSSRLLEIWLGGGFGAGLVILGSPIDVSPDDHPTNEPEPDQIVLKRDFSHFTDENPRPVDLQLVVEVADSTLGFDLKTKAGLYARAGRSEE